MAAWRVVRLAAFVFFFPWALCCGGNPQQTQGEKEVVIEQLLKQVQIGLAKVQNDLKSQGMPPLQSVTLNLTAEVKKGSDKKFTLFIWSFGHKWEKSRSQEVEVTLKPPEPTAGLVKAGPTVADQLVEAIESAAKGVQAARKDPDVPLVTSGLKVVLSFVVSGDTSVGGSGKFEIIPVTAELSRKLAKSALQKITVVYANP
jgi:hypothetical protein